MRSRSTLKWVVAAASTIGVAVTQTYTKCNPLETTCPPDPALGTSETFDFTKGPSSSFSAQGAPTYGTSGASFTVAQAGDAPTIISNWYIMFGHIDVVMQVAPGVGIVSSMVLQSDDLDEVDFEWLGADDTQVQSNYFGKGITGSYNRGAFEANPGAQNGFHTYSMDWTAEQIEWQIDGQTVRVLTQADAETNQYPQTPMQLKLGIWAGGDPSNSPGTIAWAGGLVNYGAGPYTMIVQSVKATDYSTGTEYTYTNESGEWQSIKSTGGAISGSGAVAGDPSASIAAPAVTSTATGAPEFSSTFTTPDVYPWVPSTTSLSSTMVTSYAGLPSGWTLNSSGKPIPPPSAAPTTSLPASSTPLSVVTPSVQSLAVAGGYETVTEYNQQGFPTVVVLPAGWSTMIKSFNSQGFLITPSITAAPSTMITTPSPTVSPTAAGVIVAAEDTTTSSTSALVTVSTGAANTNQQHWGLGVAACGIFALIV